MHSVGVFFLIVVFLAITELFLLINVAGALGFGTTLLLCVLTGIVGGILVRHQGFRTLERLQAEVAAGRMPADQILEGIGLIIVGAFLMVPGFLTDVGGFLMLIPSLRRLVVRQVRAAAAKNIQVHTFGQNPFGAPDGSPHDMRGGFGGGPAFDPHGRTADGDIIDVDVEVRDDGKS